MKGAESFSETQVNFYQSAGHNIQKIVFFTEYTNFSLCDSLKQKIDSPTTPTQTTGQCCVITMSSVEKVQIQVLI
jgi:uncharacterized membrane protein